MGRRRTAPEEACSGMRKDGDIKDKRKKRGRCKRREREM